jgi:hypothetical protein
VARGQEHQQLVLKTKKPQNQVHVEIVDSTEAVEKISRNDKIESAGTGDMNRERKVKTVEKAVAKDKNLAADKENIPSQAPPLDPNLISSLTHQPQLSISPSYQNLSHT